MRTVSNNSRLRFGSLFESGGVDFWDLVQPPEVPARADEIRYVLRDIDQLDLLAETFYDDPSLWWVIARANDMALVPTDLHAGTEIRIPNKRYVLQEYLNLLVDS